MTREELIRQHFHRNMRLLEIGPSYNPILPKADGWQTTVVDHATQADLVAKYAPLVATADRIEEVDFVWKGGALADLIPLDQHGSYDGLVASHVGEHLPDLIAFLKNAATLIKQDGLMALALPDKRVCFDFFQPLTTTGDLVAAHLEGRTRHQRRTFFNQAAYFVTRNDTVGWARTGLAAPFHLAHPLSLAQFSYDTADEDPAAEYRDSHAWAFTPKSFELLMLELNLLGYIDWSIRAIEPAAGVEFYVWLERKKIAMPEVAVNPLRLSLLSAIVCETKVAIAQLEGAIPAPAPPVAQASPVVAPEPSARTLDIVAIIALYNGARYIEQTLRSVLRQSLPPSEIIVVNDGSTDDGAGVAIVERMALTHPITLLHKPNGGQSSARNLGVQRSTSVLIAFLDQDDIWYENHLAELAKPFAKPSEPPLGWAYSNLDEIDENGFLICRSFLSTIGVEHPKRHIFDCIRQDMFILPSAALISREAFETIGGFDERLCGYEDDDLFLRMFRAGYHNTYLKRALSQWRIYTGSTSYSYRMALSRNIYTRKLLQMFPNDIQRVRYYIRDLIAPRFFGPALKEYDLALERDDKAASDAAWEEVMLLARHNDAIAASLTEHTLARYRAALLTGSRTTVDAAWNEVVVLTKNNEAAVPRVIEHALADYKSALLGGDSATIRTAWDKLALVQPDAPGAGHRRMRATLKLLRHPAVSRSAFALRRVGRPVMLWAFRSNPGAHPAVHR